MVKVEPIKTKELRLNVGTAAALGAVTSSKDSQVEVKLRKPLCLLPRSRVAISRRISDRWRLIVQALPLSWIRCCSNSAIILISIDKESMANISPMRITR